MCLECSPDVYLLSKKGFRAKICAIDELIDMNLTLLAGKIGDGNGAVAMYELDDGQVRIKTNYTSSKEILDANFNLEKLKTLYENKLYGRATILRSSSTFRC